VIEVIQAAVGFALFFATGFFLARAFFFDREWNVFEKAAVSLAVALTVPALVLVVLNLLLRIPFNVYTVYAVFFLLIAASWAYEKKFKKAEKHHKHQD
jgi:riboflavin transporter FmnP